MQLRRSVTRSTVRHRSAGWGRLHAVQKSAPLPSSAKTTANVKVTIKTEPVVPGTTVPSQLYIQFFDETTQQGPIAIEWKKSDNGGSYGEYTTDFPAGFSPAALTAEAFGEGRVKICSIEYESNPTDGGPAASKSFPLFSWVTPEQKQRVVFEGSATLAASSPNLQQLRTRDLKAIQGEGTDPNAPRQVWDRIYDYDVYNDLGGEFGPSARQVLGGSAEFPYPRRLRTNRKKSGDVEPNVANPWLPLDEQFSFSKQSDFLGTSLQTVVPAILETIEQIQRPRTLLGQLFFPSQRFFFRLVQLILRGGESLQYQNFSDISAAFKSNNGLYLPEHISQDSAADKIFDRAIELVTKLGDDRALEKGSKDPAQEAAIQELLRANIRDLRSFLSPKVLDDRGHLWYEDAEFGRQMVAGQNPCVLQLLTEWPKRGFNDQSVKGAVPEGKTIPELMAEKRVFFVDYWEPFMTYTKEVNYKPLSERHLYAGSCLLVLTKEQAANSPLLGQGNGASAPMTSISKKLLPIAIELNDGNVSKVYTPPVLKPSTTPGAEPQYEGTPAQIWLLARTAFLNLDSGFHQLVSHWQRTHCTLEPYLIATKRQLSSAHPVYKLILPHFRFTLNINANARGSLINANGTIEKLFTPGKYSMEIASKWYGLAWTFESQALPNDLKARGLMDENGNMLLDDYPYAEDGMDIWNALQSYFNEYLAIYYKDDAPGADNEAILGDEELQAWWREIQEKGHPDIKTGWPSLRTRADLLFILTTMAWTASAHHAAVNFGQYDFSGLILNRTSIFKKAIPTDLNSWAYKMLTSVWVQGLANAKGVQFEKKFLEYIADPKDATTILVVLKLLSSHAEDEQYLSDVEQPYLVDARAKAAHAKFTKSMKELEQTIAFRNADSNKPSRIPSANGMPYTLLMPSSEPGVTMRGVPYSVSI